MSIFEYTSKFIYIFYVLAINNKFKNKTNKNCTCQIAIEKRITSSFLKNSIQLI